MARELVNAGYTTAANTLRCLLARAQTAEAESNARAHAPGKLGGFVLIDEPRVNSKGRNALTS